MGHRRDEGGRIVMDDGDIDYSAYTLPELREAWSGINRERYPRNFANLSAALVTLGSMPPVESQAQAGEKLVGIDDAGTMPGPLFVYGHWRGRISRKTYWLFGLPPAVSAFLLDRLDVAGDQPVVFWMLFGLILVPSTMISIKRSHDLGRSGWFAVLLLLPIVNIWPCIELGFLPGVEGENRYGKPALW